MCGVCGIWSPREQATADPAEAARLMFFSLYALQHRGQESAGIAATDGRDLRVVRRMGLVGQVFSEPDLGVLTGRAAMGHTRYSTTGASKIQNAQPFTVRAEGLGELAIGHNGNCINAREIRDALAEDGVHFVTSSDTEVVAQAIVHAKGTSWDERIANALPKLVGAWSLVLLTPTALYAIRDPFGVRPLCLGRKGNSWLVASETSALDTIGAQFMRDVAPGEVLRIDDRGPVTIADLASSDRRGLCIFEHVYLASASSRLGGVSVYATRERMGEILADEHPADRRRGDPRSGQRDPGGRRLRAPQRHPVPGRPHQEPLHRPHVHPAVATSCAGTASRSSTTRCPTSSRASASSSWMTRSCAATPAVRSSTSFAATARRKCTCGSARRRSSTSASSASTWRGAAISSARGSMSRASAVTSARTRSATSRSRGWWRRPAATREEHCTACFTGDYLVPVQLELEKSVLEREPA